MVNATEDIIMPESPNIHSQQTAVFYVQNAGEYTENAAGNDKKGVASFLQGQFIVENGKVRLRTEYLTDILNPMVQSTSENAALSSMNASDCREYADRARVYSNASKDYATHGHGYAEQARKAAEDAVGIVNDAVTPIKKDIIYNSKRIENLEASLSDNAFISDSSVAYQKSVPVSVAPYASVDKIGGMTYRKVLDEGNLYPYPYKLGWSGSTVDKDGVWRCENPYKETDTFDIATDTITLPEGNYICDVGNDFGIAFINVRYSGKEVSIESIEGTSTKVRIVANDSWTFSGVDVYIYELAYVACYPMLYPEDKPITWQPRGKAELRHAKVKAIESKSKNLLNLTGWSATTDKKVLNNPFGTTVSSLEGNHITVSQSNYPNTENPASYENGFFMFFPDKHLVNGRKDYKISFDLKIINNPLDISYVHIVSNDYWNGETRIDISKTNAVQRCSGIITYNINPSFPNNCYFECRNCGISFEIGNVMITEADVEDIEYSPYGTIDTFAIPETVQALEGYGEGINASYNSIEYTADGRVLFHKLVGKVDLGTLDWIKGSTTNDGLSTVMYCVIPTMKSSSEVITSYPFNRRYDCLYWEDLTNGDMTTSSIHFVIATKDYADAASVKAAMLGVMLYYELAEPIVTDITDLMPIDNFLKVQSSGSIEAVNDYGYDVPSTIAYQKRG